MERSDAIRSPQRASMLALCALLLPAAAARAEAPSAAPAPAAPRLLLFVSVDQMWFDYLDRFAPHYTGGLKRLREEGAVFTNASYRHANSETGPGHALLLSGRHARHNGIVANAWYDRASAGVVNVVSDPLVSPLPGPGRGASPANFSGATVGDLLKHASSASRVVGVAGKDRAAILMAGPRADAAYWYESAAGAFGSSTYYMRALPPWLAEWNATRPVDALAGRSWTRLLDPPAYEALAGPDDVKGEWDNVDTVFPHRLRGAAGSSDLRDDVRRTPFLDDLTLEVALRALEGHDLGTDDSTDLLAVGFSATDSIGHTYGPDSQEVMDQLIRLDRLLGRLLEAAEARAGKDRLVVALSSDHSSMPLVEVLQAKGLPARRVSPQVVRDAVTAALAARFPQAGTLVLSWDDPHVYLDLEQVARAGLKRAEVAGVVKQALMATGVIDRVYTAEELLGDPPADDPDFALFRNSFFEPRSPQVIARLKRYVYLDDRVGGTGHGTVQDYDRHVPVVFLGTRFARGRYEASSGPEDIAPTLCFLLGLPYRVETGQRVLTEAFAPTSAQTAHAR
jgi:predicted AlkP superfamily pyrophosphatase or phosphodiesterase